MLCSAKAGDKARVFFHGYDDDNSESMDRDEFGDMMVAALARSSQLTHYLINTYAQGQNGGALIPLPDISVVGARKLAKQAFDAADADGSGEIDFGEFVAWTSSDQSFAPLLSTDERLFGPVPVPAVTRGAVDAFVAATGYKRAPIGQLFECYEDLVSCFGFGRKAAEYNCKQKVISQHFHNILGH